VTKPKPKIAAAGSAASKKGTAKIRPPGSGSAATPAQDPATDAGAETVNQRLAKRNRDRADRLKAQIERLRATFRRAVCDYGPLRATGVGPEKVDEDEKAHRGFLLWAMQEERLRSYSTAAKALDADVSQLRRWSDAYCWPARWQSMCEVEDSNPFIAAFTVYAANYEKRYGKKELPKLADAFDPTLNDAFHPWVAARARTESAERTRAASTVLRAQADAKKSRKDTLESNEDTLLDALQLASNLAKDGKLRIGASDIAPLVRALGDVQAEKAALTMGAGPANAARESTRVQIARASGEDVLNALIEDHEEDGIIFAQIRESLEQVRRNEQMARQREGLQVIEGGASKTA
jgi:hypothetical protein